MFREMYFQIGNGPRYAFYLCAFSFLWPCLELQVSQREFQEAWLGFIEWRNGEHLCLF